MRLETKRCVAAALAALVLHTGCGAARTADARGAAPPPARVHDEAAAAGYPGYGWPFSWSPLAAG